MKRRMVMLVVSAVMAAACSAPVASQPPVTPSVGPSLASPTPTAATPSSPSLPPSSEPTASAQPQPALRVGAVAVTVSDRLRIRSLPEVSDTSVRHEPLLPLGTELRIIGGPAEADGFVWWEVDPVSFALEGVETGWVAMAGKDGEQWIALADPGVDLVMANVDRVAPNPADARMAAASVNAFGLDLYRQLLADGTLAGDQNAVFSPASIALALAMVRAGAGGDTATEMDDVLHVEGWDELAAGLNALDQLLASRTATWTDYDGATREVALRIANAAFGQRGWTIEQAFLEAIASAFGSGLRLVDFVADPEVARRTINAWVSQRTAGRIPELLSRADVTTATRLYLVNAIYLKAQWSQWFAEDGTEPAAFTRPDGSEVDVPMMVRYDSSTPYARNRGWQAVELPYLAAPDTGPLAMVLVLPDDLATFEAGLDAKTLSSITEALDAERDSFREPACPPELEGGCYPYDLTLHLPRFSIETRAGLEGSLASAGMPRAFDAASADFSGINPNEPLLISKVIHQANIDVDEKGTEAAAATAVGVDTGGGPSALDHVTVRFDRPFLFVLRDVETGTVLFMGRVVDPSITR